MKLPKVESLIITVFLLIIAVWAISKCSSKRAKFVDRVRDTLEEDKEERPLRRDTVYVPQTPAAQPQTYSTSPAGNPASGNGGLPQLQNQPAPQQSPATPPATSPGARPALSNQPQAPAAAPAAAGSKYSTLYVTIDGLNMRKEPNLKSGVVARLKLNEAVYFLNKKSEKPEEINLGYEKVTDYWIKIRTKSGKDGWVFGAGVHYFKMKRKGVME